MIRLARYAVLAALAALLVPARAAAMPMPPRPVQVKNADGTTLTVRMFGDEFLSWAEDLDGYTLAYDRADGAWHYAKAGKDGRLTPLKARPGRASPAALKLKKHLKPGKADVLRANQTRQKTQRSSKATRARTTGPVEMLAVLVKFDCSTECLSTNVNTTFTAADYKTAVFNGPAGTVKDFYTKASGGKLTLTTTVYDDWIPLAHNDAYYAYNSKRYPDSIPNDVPVSEMLTEVVAYLDSKNYDFTKFADANGNIDSIGIIHIGHGFEESNSEYAIHSHQMRMSQPVVTQGGQKIFGYHTEPEVMGYSTAARITPIGVICHEMGHMLGLPDLYDTSYLSAGLGGYSLMAAGSWAGPNDNASVPVLPDAWSRTFLGWVNPTRITATTPGLRLRPAASTLDAIVIPNGMPANQYFLVENRSRAPLTGGAVNFDQYLPADGLAIYHIDDLMEDNTPPSTYDHYRVALEEADGDDALVNDPNTKGGPDDLYPSATNPPNNAFTPTSTPSSLGYDLTASQISITNIARAAPDVTFDVGITVSGKLADGFFCLGVAECVHGNCVDGVCCNTACNAGICDACSRVMGAQVDGTCFQHNFACNDGDLCTDNDACSQGACVGAPKVCPQADSCHEPSVCNPQTGVCSNVAKPENTACDDKSECTINDHCVAGVCQGTAITKCAPPDQCHLPSACIGTRCDRFVQKNDQTPCDDGDKCTKNDACMYGACIGDAVACPDPGDCYTGSACDKATGTCPTPVMRPDNATCDDKNACTKEDACKVGVCKGVVDPTVSVCPAPDGCHESGTCSAEGECVAPKKADGTTCDNGDKCFRNQKCLAGVCSGSPVTCQSSDPCYDYQCVAATGMCALKAKAEGASCESDDPCTVDATCRQGRCVGDPKQCPAQDECHTGGTCKSMTGQCSGAGLAPDGKKCNGGSCQAGTCVPDPVDAGRPDASPAGADAGGGGGGGGCSTTASSAPLALLGLAALMPLRRRRSL
ncbi:MAG: M6 family metalloprotease domain-containing protein [Myxococcales bacterium]